MESLSKGGRGREGEGMKGGTEKEKVRGCNYLTWNIHHFTSTALSNTSKGVCYNGETVRAATQIKATLRVDQSFPCSACDLHSDILPVAITIGTRKEGVVQDTLTGINWRSDGEVQ